MAVGIVFDGGDVLIVQPPGVHNPRDVDVAVCIDRDSIDFASIGSVSVEMSFPYLIALGVVFDREEIGISKSRTGNVGVLRVPSDVDIAKLIYSHAVGPISAIVVIIIS